MSHEIEGINIDSVENSLERNHDEYNKPLACENVIDNEVYTSAEQEMFQFSSDDSRADPDYQVSDGTDSEEEQVLTTAAQSAYSRKISQARRNTGQKYVNKKGRVIAQRTFRPLVSECRMRCKSKVPDSIQKEYFDKYWALGTYNQRILFIGGLIDIEDNKTKRLQKHPEKPRQRNVHVKYHLEYNGRSIQICQKCFKQCFDESESFLKSVQKKKINFPNSQFSDKRGSGAGTNKLSENDIQKIKDHINSFPKYESHYTRRDTSCMYFHADLSITQMYKLYCDENASRAVSITSYSNIFKTMNIKFKQPKIDTCHTCDRLKAKIDIAKQENNTASLKDFENELSLHHDKAELAYQSKRIDKGMAAKDLTIKTFAFDLQQCLPTPFLKTCISFYKRQLWTYNLTVHDCNTGTPYCYMWHEALSGRGGNNIASCLFKHINSLSQLKHAIFYSDSCVGQNKNSFVCAMFLLAFGANENLETVDHKFLEPGHTHMECDVDHAVIERKKKKTSAQIHHPHDWYNFVRYAGVRNRFRVIEMTKDDFFNFSLFLKNKFMWRPSNENGEKFCWKNVKWLRFKRNNFGKIFYKTSLKEEEEFQILNIVKRGVSFVSIKDVPKLTEEATIDVKKKKDLEDLLPFINPCFHAFYKTLKTNETTIDIHPDLVEDTDDE